MSIGGPHEVLPSHGSAFEEFRQYLRARGRRGGVVPLAEQRRRFVGRWHALIAEMAAA